MNSCIKYVFFLLVVAFFSCKKETSRALKPTDHLFMQRAYPYGKIDHKAYRNAVSEISRDRYKTPGIYNERWESEGPYNISGRVTDIEMDPFTPGKIYVGSASGGLLVTFDEGRTWQNLFAGQPTQAIGDVAVSRGTAGYVIAGTGEPNAGGGSIAYDGLGVFISENGGISWDHAGLEEAGSIGKVIISPADDNTIFVGAMGSLFENNPERGVFRSRDRGESWEKVLYISDSTGVVDMVVHPDNPDVLYAAAWERIRRPHYRKYGGETSGVYKTVDGGDNWVELTNGLPALPDEKGRIGLAISTSHPNVLYAIYAMADGRLNGVFRSDDHGQSWERRSNTGLSAVTFMWWFGRIFIHPADPEKVYLTSLYMHGSDDGGADWYRIFPASHVDHHALFIDPDNPEYILNGNDGGVDWSYDGGMSSFNPGGLNNVQFYTCTIDPGDPQTIYGGTQDNGTLRSRGNADNWENIFGGDGFRVLVDPTDSDRIYVEAQYGFIFASTDGGTLYYDGRNGLNGDFNWNTPLAMDPHNPSVLYTGAQKLFRSTDRAMSWEEISPDLTAGCRREGNLNFGSITSIEISAWDTDIIYVGTDCGAVWLTSDGGSTYESIRQGLPHRWVTSIEQDPHAASGVYLTLSGFRFGESDSQVFYSDDYGKNWSPVGSGLPDIPVNEIIADPDIPGTLYIATDTGVFFSEDQGDNWFRMGQGMETIAVLDLDLESASRRMAAATYGKGILTYQLDTPSRVEDFQKTAIMIYPNPVTDILYIKDLKGEIDYEIMDYKGRMVDRGHASGSIGVAHLPIGVYHLRVFDDTIVRTQRFIKV